MTYKMELRYLLWNDQRGIFLGKVDEDGTSRQVWSLDVKIPAQFKSAPTFYGWGEVGEFTPIAGLPPHCQLKEVHPDLPTKAASMAACMNVLLPSWTTE